MFKFDQNRGMNKIKIIYSNIKDSVIFVSKFTNTHFLLFK